MIIGLCGPIGAGKTTVAKYLVDQHDFERVPFAKVLKDMARAFGLTEEQINGALKETPTEEGWSPRQWMQWCGTDFGRKMLGPDVWVNRWKHRAKSFKRVVADDVRFANEVDAIHALGGKVILVDRGIKWADGQHSSENWHTLKWDHGISNTGTMQDLFEGLERMLFVHS